MRVPSTLSHNAADITRTLCLDMCTSDCGRNHIHHACILQYSMYCPGATACVQHTHTHTHTHAHTHTHTHTHAHTHTHTHTGHHYTIHTHQHNLQAEIVLKCYPTSSTPFSDKRFLYIYKHESPQRKCKDVGRSIVLHVAS